MTPTTQDTMQKITGNVSDELTEAGYRLAATGLVSAIRQRITSHDEGLGIETQKFLASDNGEAFLSFVLAVALEVLPTDSLVEPRRCLASNLRIQAYEILGASLLKFAGLINKEVEAVLVTKAVDLAAIAKAAEDKKYKAAGEEKAA
jgi:hypothetical protein